MCGIVGYVGPRDAAPVLLKGLHRLEYRGYDSAGVALVCICCAPKPRISANIRMVIIFFIFQMYLVIL